MEYNLARRKDKIMKFFATWMELEGSKLSKMSQKEKRQTSDGLAYIWSIK